MTPSERELCSTISTISRFRESGGRPGAAADRPRHRRSLLHVVPQGHQAVRARPRRHLRRGSQRPSSCGCFNAHYDEYDFGRSSCRRRGPLVRRRPPPRQTAQRHGDQPLPARAAHAPSARQLAAHRSTCCAATAAVAGPRFSTGVGPTASTTSSALHRPRPCGGASRPSRPARRRRSEGFAARRQGPTVRGTSTAAGAGAASGGASTASKSAQKEPFAERRHHTERTQLFAPLQSLRRTARPKTTSVSFKAGLAAIRASPTASHRRSASLFLHPSAYWLIQVYTSRCQSADPARRPVQHPAPAPTVNLGAHVVSRDYGAGTFSRGVLAQAGSLALLPQTHPYVSSPEESGRQKAPPTSEPVPFDRGHLPPAGSGPGPEPAPARPQPAKLQESPRNHAAGWPIS